MKLPDYNLTDPAYWQDDSDACLDAAIDEAAEDDNTLLSAAVEVQTAGELASSTMTQALVATALREAMADAVRRVCSGSLDARKAVRSMLEPDARRALELAAADEPA